MLNKKLLLPAFILVALFQLYIPAKMIWDREDVINTGKDYKFRTAPIDPNDPFRGKYINLSYTDNSIVVSEDQEWIPGESIYATVSTDTNGLAIISSISRNRPKKDLDFIKAKVGFITENNPKKLFIDYPFDRYYMEESKAYDAELLYRKVQADTNKITYALVSVKKGEAVLKDVIIDGTSIRELVKSNRKKIE